MKINLSGYSKPSTERTFAVGIIYLLTSFIVHAQTSWTGSGGDGNFTNELNWTAEPPTPTGSGTINQASGTVDISLTADYTVGSLITTGSGTINFSLGSNSFTINGGNYAPALFVTQGSTLSLTGLGSTVTVESGQVFVGDQNGNGTLNIGTSLNLDAQDLGSTYAYLVVGRNDDPNTYALSASGTSGTGVVNQTSGTVTMGGAVMIGLDMGNGTYNLSGGTLTNGSVGTFFPVYIGLNQSVNDDRSTSGTLNITGTATLTTTTGAGFFVGTGLNGNGDNATVGGTGKIIQNGVGTAVTLGGYGATFGTFDASGGTLGTGGIGTYELDAGTLTVTAGTFDFGQAAGGTGYLNQNGGNFTSDVTVIIGDAGTGTFTLTGTSVATLNNGLLLANQAGSNGTVNLQGGLLQVGGVNGISKGSGTATLNLGHATIEVIGSNLTSNVDVTLTGSTSSTINTNGFNATFSGNINNDGSGNSQLVKIGAGNLEMDGASNAITSFFVNGGTGTQTTGTFTSYEFGVGSGLGNTGTFTLSNGTVIIAAGKPPAIPGGAASTFRIGDFHGTGTFIQTGGDIEVNGGSLNIGNQGGHGTYVLSGGVLNLNDGGISTLGRDYDAGTTYTGATGELDISGNGQLNINDTSSLIGSDWNALGDGYTGSGVINQTGGTVTVGGSATIYVTAGGSGTYNLSGGVLNIGGSSLVGLRFGYNGTYAFNFGAGTIQVVGTALDTAINMNLTSDVYSTIDTGTLGATLSGTINGATGGLDKKGASTLVLSGSNNAIGSFGILGGTVSQATGTLTTTELAVGTGLGNTGNYNLSGGTIIFPGGVTPPIVGNGIVGASSPSFRVGDFGGTGTFTQTGGSVIVDGGMDIGNQGGTGTYDISGGTLDLSGGLYALGRTTSSSSAPSASSGTMNISGTAVVTVHNGNFIIGDRDSTGLQGSGILNQTGGTLTISGTSSALFLSANGNGVYNLTGGVLQVGGNGLNANYQGSGTYQFNFGQAEIQVIGTALTTGVNINLTSDLYSFIDTGTLGATLSGTINGATGGLVKLGSSNLILNGSNNAIGSFKVAGGGIIQSTGTLTTSELAVGTGTGNTGSYTLSGGSLIFPGGLTPPIVGNGTVGASSSSFRIGDFGGTGTFTQTSGTVTLGSLTGTSSMVIGNKGGNGTYNLEGGLLALLGPGYIDLGLSDNPSEGQTTGTLNISGGTLEIGSKGNLEIGNNNAGVPIDQATGVINQTGGTIIIDAGGNFYLSGYGTGTYNFDGGVLEIGGASLQAHVGTAPPTTNFNLGGGTIEVTGTAVFDTNVDMSLVSGTRSTINTNGQNAVFRGNVQNDSNNNGGLNKIGVGDLTLSGSNNSISSFYIAGGSVTQGAGSSLTSYETSVGFGVGDTSTYFMNGGNLILAAGAPPPLVGGDASSLRIGDFGGTGTFTQTGGSVTDYGSLNIGSNGGNGTYNLSAGFLTLNNSISDLAYSASTVSTGTFNLSGTGVIALDNGTNFILSNRAAGPGGTGVFNQTGGTFTIDATSALFLTGSGFGTYNLDGGMLRVGGAGLQDVYLRQGGTYAFNLGGGTIQVVGSNLTTNVDMNLVAGTTSTFDTNGLNATFNGALTGSGNLAMTGTGSLTLADLDTTGLFDLQNGTAISTGASNFVDQFAVDGGHVTTLQISTGNAFAVATETQVDQNSTLNLSGSGTFNSSGAFIIGDASSSGTVNISAGTANLQNGATVGNTAGSVGTVNQSGGTVNLTGGSLDLKQSTSTYNLAGGRFAVGGSGVTGLGSLNVAGGTLTGNGLVTAATVVSSGGIIAPGSTTAGIHTPGLLSFSNLSLTSGSIIAWNLANESLSGPGINFDQIQATAGGNILVDGALTFDLTFGSGINFSDSFWTTDESWTVIDATASGASLSGTATYTISSPGATGGTFNVVQTGNQVQVTWTTSAVPEPSTYLMLLGGAAFLFLALRRKRQC